MGMTSPLDEVDYDRRDFNKDISITRHPPFITDKQVEYKLVEMESGELTCARDPTTGEPIKSPRKLQQMCINHMVCDSCHSTHPLLSLLDGNLLPSPIYPQLLTEAILFREPRAIECIVSTWPMRVLRVSDYVPPEDNLTDDYLTNPIEGHDDLTLADCIVLGLLKLKSSSLLMRVDFSAFNKDRRLCKELSRLPILWLKPSDRITDKLHQQMSTTLDIGRQKVECFLNRIRAVYSNIDPEFEHGGDVGPITILTDMHINIDDVPIGLSLQGCNPFKFISRRVWIKPIHDVFFPINQLANVLNAKVITHLEYEDVQLPGDLTRQFYLLESLQTLTNLVALSLPDCLNSSVDVAAILKLSDQLKQLKQLRRINLSYCNLRNNLEIMLSGLPSQIEYLNLKDCRLNEEDLFSLLVWRQLPRLRELNLSCNNLQHHEEIMLAIVQRMCDITCLSVSFCSLSVNSQVSILHNLMDRYKLRVICLQGYIPPSRADLIQLLEGCCNMHQLQKVVLFPEVYAFPGDVEQERRVNKLMTLNFSYRLLELNGRSDLKLE